MRARQFTDAKQVFRAHPDYTDTQVAEEIGVRPGDSVGMSTVAQARKDVAASDTHNPHLPGNR